MKKTPKAKYNFTSKQLKDRKIDIAEFVESPWDAVSDLASDIAQCKGYGSEGMCGVMEEIFEGLGVEEDDRECLGDEDLEFTIDGKLPNTKALAISKLKKELLAAQIRVKSITSELKKLNK